jgi:hypothetical protein
MIAGTPMARALRVAFRPEWEPEASGSTARGFFAADPRARTLLRVLLSYPEVRYVVPDRISLDGAAGPALMETIARFVERQTWLVQRVVIA